MPTVSPGRRAGGLMRGIVEEDIRQEPVTKSEQSNSEKTLPGKPGAPSREETRASPPDAPSGFPPERAPEPAIQPCPPPSRPQPLRKTRCRRIASLPLRVRKNVRSHHACHRPQPSQCSRRL